MDSLIHIWYVTIAFAVVSAVFAGLIALEFASVRDKFRVRITALMLSLGVVLVAQEVTTAVSFMMWSKSSEPLYVYPSLMISSLGLIGVVILYAITRI